MFLSQHQWDVLVEARIDDLYAAARRSGAPATPGRATSVVAAARRTIGRALIGAGVRIAGADGAPARPATPAHFAA